MAMNLFLPLGTTSIPKFQNSWPESSFHPPDLVETKQKTPYFTGKQSGGVVSPRRGGDNTTAPAPSPFGAKVRAAGPLRTPEARHSDFRRMSALSNW